MNLENSNNRFTINGQRFLYVPFEMHKINPY